MSELQREPRRREGAGSDHRPTWPSGFLSPLPAQCVRVQSKAPANSLAVCRKPWFHNCFIFSLSVFSLRSTTIETKKKKKEREGRVRDKHRDRGEEGREAKETEDCGRRCRCVRSSRHKPTDLKSLFPSNPTIALWSCVRQGWGKWIKVPRL